MVSWHRESFSLYELQGQYMNQQTKIFVYDVFDDDQTDVTDNGRCILYDVFDDDQTDVTDNGRCICIRRV